MRAPVTIFISSLICFLLLQQTLHAGIILVKDKTPNAVIIISTNATEAEHFAAWEIQRYINKISGVLLPIINDDMDLDGEWVFTFENLWVNKETDTGTLPSRGCMILIGKNRYVKEMNISLDTDTDRPDPFLIKTTGNRLILLGQGDRGTVYSVYAFLEEHLGCRWFMPGPLGEVIPRNVSIIRVKEINDLQVPGF
jgi:hypothetical protein